MVLQELNEVLKIFLFVLDAGSLRPVVTLHELGDEGLHLGVGDLSRAQGV